MKKLILLIIILYPFSAFSLEKTKSEKVAKYIITNIQKDYVTCYSFYKVGAEVFKKTKKDKKMINGLEKSADVALKFNYDLGEVLGLKPGFMTQTTKIDWKTASLIVWQAQIPTGAVAAQLQEFAASGGSVIFFPPEKPSENMIFGTSWGVIEDAPSDKYFINGSWIKDDGPWKNSLGDQKMPVDQVRGVKRCTIKGDGSSLAEWDDGSPLLYRQLEGLGIAIFINTLPDDRWSNLEFVALHLVAIQRLLEKGTDRLHSGYRAIAGSEKAKLRNDEVRDRLDAFEDYEPALSSYRSGVYRLGERTVAVNRPSAENSPLRVDVEALDALLEGTSYSLFESNKDDENLVSPVWWAFLIAVLFFLLAEATLSLQPKITGPPAFSTKKTSPVS